MLIHRLIKLYPFILWAADGGGSGSGDGGSGDGSGNSGGFAGDGSGGQGGSPGDGGQGSGEDGTGDGQPGPVPYDRFKQVNDRAKELETRLAQLEADQKKAKEKELADQQKWQELAEQREKELQTERHQRLRLEVATAKGLPPDLAARLQGDSKEDLEKDADSLLQFMKPASGPGVPPAGPGKPKQPLDLANMSPKQIREKTKGKPLNDLLNNQ